MEHSEFQLADDLTNEPVVFMGCTGSEISVVAMVCGVVSLITAVIAFIVLFNVSSSLAILAAAVIVMGGTIALSVYVLRKLMTNKEERGDNYYKEVLQLRLSEWGVGHRIFNQTLSFQRGRSL